MYTVYVLQSQKNGRYYIGYTSNIDQRIKQHNSRKNKSTRQGSPWIIVYQESAETRELAWKREHQIKSYKGGRAFKDLVQK